MRLLLFLIIGLHQSAHSKLIQLHRGLMTAEGSLNFPIEYNYNYHTNISMSITPRIGYFVLDNFCLGAGTDIKFKIFDTAPSLSPKESVFWGLGIGAKYYFSTNTNFFPSLGFYFSTAIQDTVLVSLQWALEIPIGILWALNEHVGVSMGIPVRINFTARSIFNSIVITPGILGIIAFF